MGCIPIRKNTEAKFVNDTAEESQPRKYNHRENILYTIKEEHSIFEHSDRYLDYRINHK